MTDESLDNIERTIRSWLQPVRDAAAIEALMESVALARRTTSPEEFNTFLMYPPDQIQTAWISIDPGMGEPDILARRDVDFSTSVSAADGVFRLLRGTARGGLLWELSRMGVWTD